MKIMFMHGFSFGCSLFVGYGGLFELDLQLGY